MDWTGLGDHTKTYCLLVAAALTVGIGVGIPLGVAAARLPHAKAPLLALANLGRVVPSLAVLTFVLPLLGVGFVPALVALSLLAIAPVAITTDVAFTALPHAELEAARALGMTAVQRFARVEWPLALPVVFSGVRTAATEIIASAVLASFIGAGGLGDYITTGLSANLPQELWTGVIAIAIIALLAQSILALAARRIGEPGG